VFSRLYNRKLGLTTSVIALIILTPGIRAFAQEDPAPHAALDMSLTNAIATGIATNPEYGEVAANRRATDEELKQGRALYLPSIDAHAETGPEWTNSPSTRSSAFATNSDSTARKWHNLASVTLTQLLFDGFNAQYEVERQKARVQSAANRVRETAELVGLSIVESYLEVMRQRQLLMIARQNVQDHETLYNQIEDGVRAGKSTQADEEQAKERVAVARATESSTRQSLRTAEAKYIQVVGDQPGQLELPTIPYDKLDADVNAEVLKTLAYSPTLNIFTADIETAYAESLQTRSSFYPKVNLQVGASAGHDLQGVDGGDSNASALVVANWNLYRGGADIARAREFIERHSQAKESRMKAAREVENDVRSTWASMVSAGERAKEFDNQAMANEQVVKAYKDQFNLDRRTLLDVLDAQNELFVSRSNTINSEFLEMLAVYRLLALKGQLLPTLNVSYPRESFVSENDRWSQAEKLEAR